MEQENYIPSDFSIEAEALQNGSERAFEAVFQYYYARILFFSELHQRYPKNFKERTKE